jgi:unsaturated rhamnogalacturonyl hydrolase
MNIRFFSLFNKLLSFSLLVLILTPALAQEWNIGMSSSGTLISASGYQVDGQNRPTVVLIGGLDGEPASSEKVLAEYQRYLMRDRAEQPFNLIVIPHANPEGETLTFPPTGRAYADDPVSFGLWRWLGTHGPDLVLIESNRDFDLADMLSNQIVAGVGFVPALHLYDEPEELARIMTETNNLPFSGAHEILDRRLGRSPTEFAEQLAAIYGHDFSSPVYIPGMALIGRMRLGYLEEVEALVTPYLQGADIEIRSNLVIGGHQVFSELAERTGKPEYLTLAKKAADLGFDANGTMLEAMPFHRELSDDYFMSTPLLAKVGKLTGEEKYFDMAVQHIRFLEQRVRRPDGLYRHSPLVDAAWSRANSFPALGLALTLSEFPEAHPGFEELKLIYQAHMETLLTHQDSDGMWHMMIDYPGIYPELSATAMIALAMRRGINRGWLDDTYSPAVEKAWRAVLMRSSGEGYFVDVSESTNKLDSMAAYLTREALMGPDDRTGGMLMMLAVEMAGLR